MLCKVQRNFVILEFTYKLNNSIQVKRILGLTGMLWLHQMANIWAYSGKHKMTKQQ